MPNTLVQMQLSYYEMQHVISANAIIMKAVQCVIDKNELRYDA